MGSHMISAGLSVLEFAEIHEHIIIDKVLPNLSIDTQAATIKQAAIFFSSALHTPKPSVRGSTQRITRSNNATVAMLSQRSTEFSIENSKLKQEINNCKINELALVDGEKRIVFLLERSRVQEAQMRQLSRDVLAAQENERKEISRDLHDVIAQTLAGINIRLAALKREAELNAKGIDHKITHAQQMVSKAVDIVHRYARKLRPEVLDDLGLIPALDCYLRTMRARTGIHIKMKACADVEGLNLAKRTVLFRVAQEALTNISRHAHAENISVDISSVSGGFRMDIQDDGRSFDPQRVMLSSRKGHLGIIGMRERLEMVGGSFEIVSSQGKGTLVIAKIQAGKGATRRITNNLNGGRR